MHTCTPRLDRSFCWTSATTFVYLLLNHTLHNVSHNVIHIFTVNYLQSYTCHIHYRYEASHIVLTIFSISYEVQYVMFPSYKAESARVLLKVTCLPIGRELVYKLPQQKMLNALITSPPYSFSFILVKKSSNWHRVHCSNPKVAHSNHHTTYALTLEFES